MQQHLEDTRNDAEERARQAEGEARRLRDELEATKRGEKDMVKKVSGK